MRIKLAAKSIACPKTPALAIEQRITCPFKGQIRRQFEHLKIVFLKPSPEVFFFPLPFAVQKTAEDKSVPHSHSRIGCEHHIGQSRLRCDFLDLRVFFQNVKKTLPLFRRCLA